MFDRNYTALDVSSFIRQKLAPLFPRDAYLILDNASNQKHNLVLTAMEEALDERYFFCAPYSRPELKPIERVFSMGPAWIRNHENDIDSSVNLIGPAFQNYAVDGPCGSHCCYNLFRFYNVIISTF